MTVETVLVAVGSGDGGRADEMAAAAADVAESAGAEVVLGHSFTEESLDEAVEQLNYEAGGQIVVDEVARRHAETRAVAEKLESAGVDYRVRGAVGTVHADAIVELARGEDADRVIVGGRGRTPTGKAVFGSTAQTVLLTAPCPVTYVRDN